MRVPYCTCASTHSGWHRWWSGGLELQALQAQPKRSSVSASSIFNTMVILDQSPRWPADASIQRASIPIAHKLIAPWCTADSQDTSMFPVFTATCARPAPRTTKIQTDDGSPHNAPAVLCRRAASSMLRVVCGSWSQRSKQIFKIDNMRPRGGTGTCLVTTTQPTVPASVCCSTCGFRKKIEIKKQRYFRRTLPVSAPGPRQRHR